MAASRNIIWLVAFVALGIVPAFAAKTCVIIYSPGSNGDWSEKYWHEMAHCNGWVHPKRESAFGKSHKPPKRFLFVYPGPIDPRLLSPAEALKECGAFGCQWFE